MAVLLVYSQRGTSHNKNPSNMSRRLGAISSGTGCDSCCMRAAQTELTLHLLFSSVVFRYPRSLLPGDDCSRMPYHLQAMSGSSSLHYVGSRRDEMMNSRTEQDDGKHKYGCGCILRPDPFHRSTTISLDLALILLSFHHLITPDTKEDALLHLHPRSSRLYRSRPELQTRLLPVQVSPASLSRHDLEAWKAN